MKRVFISPKISSQKKKKVTQIVARYSGIIVETAEFADLRISDSSELPNYRQRNGTLSITILCLMSMDQKNIDPFSFSWQCGFLRNLYLYKQTFMLYQIAPEKVQHIEILVESMGGQMKADNADYCLTENKTRLPIKSLVSTDWLYALQYSQNYIGPSNYSLYQETSLSQFRAKTTFLSQKPSILGKLDLLQIDSHSQKIPKTNFTCIPQVKKKTPILNGKLMIICSDSKPSETGINTFKKRENITNVQNNILLSYSEKNIVPKNKPEHQRQHQNQQAVHQQSPRFTNQHSQLNSKLSQTSSQISNNFNTDCNNLPEQFESAELFSSILMDRKQKERKKNKFISYNFPSFCSENPKKVSTEDLMQFSQVDNSDDDDDSNEIKISYDESSENCIPIDIDPNIPLSQDPLLLAFL